MLKCIFLKIYCLSMSHCGALPVVEAQCSGSLTISSHRSHVKFSSALTASDSKQSLGRRAWESHLSRFWAHNPYLLTHEKTTQTTASKFCITATRLCWSTLAKFCESSFARSGWISFKAIIKLQLPDKDSTCFLFALHVIYKRPQC